MTVKEQLIEAIDCNLAYLPEIPQGTEEQKIATDSTTKLLNELREMEKSEKDNEIKQTKQIKKFLLKLHL